MKRYSDYKDSGVEWIGEIPSHWQVKPIKYFTEFYNGDRGENYPTSKDMVEYGIPFINAGNIANGVFNSQGFDYITEKKYKSLGGLKIQEGDLIYCLRGSVGRNAIAYMSEGTVNSCMVGIRCKNYNFEYLHYCMNSDIEKIYRDISSSGSVQAQMPGEVLKNIVLPIPELDEQSKIVKYLHKKTSQIETLISKKEELIETLKASRTKLISETVTKGLDKNVPMKDSGVEWIGEIPSHWDINRLKYICSINPQKSEVKLSKSSKVSFVPMENVSLNTLILDTDKELVDVYGGYTYFKDGDIVFAKVTPCFENGNMAIAKNLTNGVGFGSTELNVLRADENIIDKEFLYYVIQSDKFKNEAIANMYGVAGLKRISTKFIEDYNVLLPLIEEQRKIIEFLNLKTNYIDKIIIKTEEQIEILKKAKQKLITEVVTGKIDVTNI
jgi:type I restriction enzyme, S subunit